MKPFIIVLILICFSCSKEFDYQLFTCSECTAKAKIYSGEKFVNELIFDCQEPTGKIIQLELNPGSYIAKFSYPEKKEIEFRVTGINEIFFDLSIVK
jgi:hypothetical protein